MGNYNPVYKTIWTSQKFNLLDASEKLIYLYLITNEKIKQTGVYNIMLKHIACECGLMLPDVEKSIKRMAKIRLISYWHEENLIYIPKFFRFSKGMIKNPKILAETIYRQKELLTNHSVWKLFDEEYQQEMQFINDALIKHQSNKDNNSSNSKNISDNNHNSKEDKE